MTLTLFGLLKSVRTGALLVLVALLVLFCASSAAWAFPPDGAPIEVEEAAQLSIKVDQVGYPLAGPKVALVSVLAERFEVRRAADNAVVFSAKLAPAEFDVLTGDQVRAADFSAMRQTGSYYIYVPGVGRSWKFNVSENPFARTYYLSMLGFYGQRCGTAVDLGPEFPGYKHPACHLKGEFHPSSGQSGERDNVGGWHDAGDYGRYVVNSGITAGTLLWTWEIFGDRVKGIPLKVPESGNGTPDLLNEARWGIEWMLKMQDADGGVWHKQTGAGFPGFIMPEADTEPSKVIGTGVAPYKSTCATADLAAVAAIAARVYPPYDALFAARALTAARKAWAWAEKNPNVPFNNPPGIYSGTYGDAHCQDERLWAAAELWRTTGEASFHSFFASNYAKYLSTLDKPPSEGWADVGAMGLWSYALSTRAGKDAKVNQAIRERTVKAARLLVERTRRNPYHVSMQPRDYVGDRMA